MLNESKSNYHIQINKINKIIGLSFAAPAAKLCEAFEAQLLYSPLCSLRLQIRIEREARAQVEHLLAQAHIRLEAARLRHQLLQADVALVIGANDVVNPSARTDKSSPIYGMPILNADQAQNVIVIKRGKGTGYSGVENALFYTDNCRMLYGDAQPMAGEIIQHLKAMG